MAGLPPFFQTTNGGKPVVDDLLNFEIGGENQENSNHFETFDESDFGDLNIDKLPDFFSNSNNDDGLDILDSLNSLSIQEVKNQSVFTNEELSFDYSSNDYKSDPAPGPPGLTKSSDLLADLRFLSGRPAPAVAPTLQEPKLVGMVQPQTAPKMSYASMVAPNASSLPIQQGLPIQQPTWQQQDGNHNQQNSNQSTPYSRNSSNNRNWQQQQDPSGRTQQGYQKGGRGYNQRNYYQDNHQRNNQSLDGSVQYLDGYDRNRGGKRNGAKYMSDYDIRRITSYMLQSVQSTDPFSDDFYFIQLNIKKNQKQREEAVLEQKPQPPLLYVPLPTWKDTKERIKQQLQSSKMAVQSRTREWETQEQVLGHRNRFDASRPAERLTLPTLQEIEADFLLDNDDDGAWKSPFSSRLWTVRAAVQRGYEALYTVQELRHLMSSPMINCNAGITNEIASEIDQASSVLSQTVGIRVLPSLNQDSSNSFSIDAGHLGAILQTSIGKKLISRVLSLLIPSHRWSLLPLVLARILLSPPVAGSHGTSTNDQPSSHEAVEQRLLRTIVEFLQYSYKYLVDLQRTSDERFSTFANELISNLRICIKSVMVSQMEKKRLSESLISNRSRAEVLHLIVQIGDKVSPLAELKLKEEWIQTREAFMSMLDN